jgi:hypothetical protein
LDSPIKYTGYWWLPTNPDQKVSGTLYIDREKGIELKTIDSLLSRQELFSNNLDVFSKEVILGQTVGANKLITLIDCKCKSNEHWDSKFCLIGKRHFLTNADITFTSAEVRFSLLDEWLSVAGFNQREDSDAQGQNIFNLEYRFPDPIEFYITHINTQLSTNYILSTTSIRNLKWELAHSSFLKLTPEEPQSLEWYMRQFYSLQKLLTILTGFIVSPIRVLGYGNDVQVAQNSTVKEEFEIYYQLSNNFQNIVDKHRNQLLLPVPFLGIDLSAVVNNWFEKTEILDPVTNLYVATLSTPSLYPEFKLLNYAQALEALHRRVVGGKYMSDEEYEVIRNRLDESIPETVSIDHRNSLKGRLKYGNEFSQRTRIKALLDEVWENCLNQFIDNKCRFLETVISTRNYLVHFDESSASRAVFGTEVFYLAEKLKILLLTSLLIQLGIPRDNVYRAIKEFNEFSYLKRI